MIVVLQKIKIWRGLQAGQEAAKKVCVSLLNLRLRMVAITTRVEIVPDVSDVMCLPGESNSVGADHVHHTCLSQEVLSRFKSRVPLAQNKYGLIPIVLSICGHGLITVNELRTHKADFIWNPKPCGNQQDPKAERSEEKGVLLISDKRDICLLKIPASVFRCMLVSQYIAPPSLGLNGPDPADVDLIPDFKAQFLLKHVEIVYETVSRRVELTAHSLKQQIGFVAQQRVPVMAQIELMVRSPCVDFVDADELPVPGIPWWKRESHNYEFRCRQFSI